MKALVVYDSVFGNTEQVAYTIRCSLGSDVEALRVGDVKHKQVAGLDYLIVGSPTRAFNPTKAITNFLKKMPRDSLNGVKVAAFDTRLDTDDVNSSVLNVFVKFFGYAAKPIADRLRKKGGTLIAPPEGFYVEDTEGPLKTGELERAAAWITGITES
jgi:flavodoxin